MQRYFIEQSFELGQAILTGDDAKHITKVMRMTAGDQVIVVAKNEAHICDIVSAEQEVVVKQTGNIITSPEMPIRVTIACGLPKGDKLELIAQKGTELGMYELLPFAAERSIVKWDEKKGKKNQERLQKIAKEAAEQSHRTYIPTVQMPISFKQLLNAVANYDAVFIADEEDAKVQQRTRFADKLKRVYDNKSESILCIFGPEGGISRAEVEALRATGAQIMSLGPRILRAETAPLYALSAISYEFE